MTRHIDATTMARLDAGGLRLRHRLAGPEDGDLAVDPITIPPSLAAVQCPVCPSRTPAGVNADFLHEPGCELADELDEQRMADRVELLARRAAGETGHLRRAAVGAEVDCWTAWGWEAAGAPVVIDLDDQDQPTYWWPTLAPDC